MKQTGSIEGSYQFRKIKKRLVRSDAVAHANAIHQISSFLQPKLTLSKKVSDNRTYGLRYQFTSHGRLRMYQSRQERSELISCLPFASIKLTCRAQKEQSTINKTPLDRSTQCKQKNRELLLHTTHTWSPWHMPRKPQVFCCWQLSSGPWPWSSHLAMLQVTNFCPAYSLQKKKLSCVDVRLLTAMHFW